MKGYLKFLIILLSGVLFSIFSGSAQSITDVDFQYEQEGLTERQAAAHLLSRFTYGARYGEIDAVVEMGLEKWFQQQLNGGLPDDSLHQMLSQYDGLNLTNTEIMNTYPKGGQVLRMAIRDGFIIKDSVDKTNKKEYKSQVEAYMEKMGLKPRKELFRQFFNQKILRAAYTNNQLQELLTDFWFNHFNVSVSKNNCAPFVPAYERDVIRPNVLGKFPDLLLATAKSPAMLMYLDNFSSSRTHGNEDEQERAQQFIAGQMWEDSTSASMKRIKQLQKNKKNQGLNENYAREVMELHTLGVDVGYTQQDVTQAARVLTGWTVYPMGNKGYGQAMKKKIQKEKLVQKGFVHDGDFLFIPNRHDNKEKTVMGKHFAANGGYQEGVDLLKMLAHHPSTAEFISRKIAVRFVSDNPPQSLVDKMAETFIESEGDMKQVIITMASSSEFWSTKSLREKIKSPFELAISAVRSLNAEIKQPYQLYHWVNKMGQKMYFYQAPTGFPDKGQYWINTGALLNRMNFGLALATQRISGVRINLEALNNNQEPESAEAALLTYSKMIMPERNLNESISRLKPMLNDPELIRKVDEVAGITGELHQEDMMINEDDITLDDEAADKIKGKSSYRALQSTPGNNSMLSQVVGLIIGSPEFQRK